MIAILTATPPAPTVVFGSLAEYVLSWIGRTEVTVALVNTVAAFLCILLPYLLGSVQPAYLLSRAVYHTDLHSFGNGAPDTLNMLECHGRMAAFWTLLLNALKMFIAMALGLLLWGFNGRALAGFFLLFGHLFPIFNRFVGGRGVTCMVMLVTLTSPIAGAIFLLIFLIGAIGTRMVAFGTLLATLLNPMILSAFYSLPDLSIAMSVLCVLFIMIAHWGNVRRILDGKEDKLDLSLIFSKKGGK